jgi:hypothetical protein
VHIVFEGHHGTKAGAHFNAVCVDPSSGGTIFVTKELRVSIVAEIKHDAEGMSSCLRI